MIRKGLFGFSVILVLLTAVSWWHSWYGTCQVPGEGRDWRVEDGWYLSSQWDGNDLALQGCRGYLRTHFGLTTSWLDDLNATNLRAGRHFQLIINTTRLSDWERPAVRYSVATGVVNCRYWLVLAAFSVYPVFFLIRGPLRRHPRRKRNECIRCGYQLEGNASRVCPECGEAVGQALSEEGEE